MLNILLYLAPAVLSFVFGWNSSSICVGSLVGSRILSYRQGLIAASLGLVAGTVLEGWKMQPELLFKLNSKGSPEVLTAISLTALILMAATLLKIPAALSNVLVFSLLGYAIFFQSTVSILNLIVLVLIWVLSPLISAVLSNVVGRLLDRGNFKLNLIHLDFAYTIIGVVIGFYLSYTLGANNIGFIVGLLSDNLQERLTFSFILTISSLLGMLMFSSAIIKSVGEDIVVLSPKKLLLSLSSAISIMWVSTQFSLPNSVTINYVGAVLGAAMSSSVFLINIRYLKKILFTWTGLTVFSVLVTYLALKIIFQQT